MPRFQFIRIPLVLLLITVCATQATSMKSQFRTLKPGQNITGKIESINTMHFMDCSRRCSTEAECRAYQYTGSRPENCLLIHRNSTAEDALSILSHQQIIIYKMKCLLDCQNGGRCGEENDLFRCWCPEEFHGGSCEEKDECHSNPCIHGQCWDYQNSYSCGCSPGYHGVNCESDIDECNSLPCAHGNCSNNVNNYTCQCLTGYTGANCETDINECESDPCVHGNCSDMFNGYNCTCQNGYSGENCEDVETACTQPSSWYPNAGWTGPDPEVYWSFDCVDSLVLMEGTAAVNAMVIPGKVNKAITVDRTMSQWVDLLPDRRANQVIDSEPLEGPCLPRPEDCGVADGALAFCMRQTDRGSSSGVISSRSKDGQASASFQISYSGTTLSLKFSTQNGHFKVDVTTVTNDWTQLVLNYIGPNDGEGIQVYQDGVQTGNDDTVTAKGFDIGFGGVVIGRQFTNLDEKYSSVDIDELLFFNAKLTGEQITSIHTMV